MIDLMLNLILDLGLRLMFLNSRYDLNGLKFGRLSLDFKIFFLSFFSFLMNDLFLFLFLLLNIFNRLHLILIDIFLNLIGILVINYLLDFSCLFLRCLLNFLH